MVYSRDSSDWYARNVWTVAIASICKEHIALLNISSWIKELECEVISAGSAQNSDALVSCNPDANLESWIAHKQYDGRVRLNALYDTNETML
jgi:hypothetical protein